MRSSDGVASTPDHGPPSPPPDGTQPAHPVATDLPPLSRRVLHYPWRSLRFWTRSLLFRVVVVTLLLSTVVMVGVGFVLQSQITSRLLQTKQEAARDSIKRAVDVVSVSMNGADTDDISQKEALQRTLDELGNPARTGSSANDSSSNAGSFEPVIVPSRELASDANAYGPASDVPSDLAAQVSAGDMAWVYTSINRNDATIPALVIGAPAATSAATYSVYLIFPLSQEQGAVALVQRTLLVGGLALGLAVAVIAALVALQVIAPVRRAAGVARRLAAGDLGERMPLSGPVELATLARSFNGMADAIRAQIGQLEEFGKLQRQFTSDVSHELRTPVTTVRMAADVLHSSRDELPPHLGRSTELLVEELDRFETLLSDLLEISRHDAGMADLSAEPMDLRALIKVAVSGSVALAEKAGVTLRMHLPQDPEVAEVDNRRVERILRNLINNAIDHAEGGDVDIELAGGPDAVAVTVTDYGVGLKPEEADLVFNRFWRADPSRQRHTGGTGLGLAIALEDARLHGGWLQASGRPGRGARFRLTLPRYKGELIESSPLPLLAAADDDTVIIRLPSSTPTIAGRVLEQPS